MPSYTPPLRDMQFVLHEVLHAVDDLKQIPAHAELDEATVNAVIEEAGKFASQVLQPTNRTGDLEGCSFDAATHSVKTPTGFKEAYRTYVEGGWTGLSIDPQWGGQGLPSTLTQVLYEMLNSANQAWTMYPGLGQGVYACLAAHGSDEQKQAFLPKLASGEWGGTMCLTEPHCGTDLGLLRTRAEPLPDGSYKLTGQKIFISAGDQDFTDNIVHLVLARLPDAPAGSRGISLFVVSKFHLKADGGLGGRNPIFCGGIEHKMGIKGSATCQMLLDGAVGTLVGPPNKGLLAMFVMMNTARLGVGLQSLGLMEVAYQNAVAYAKDRIQMRALSGPKAPQQPADPIIVHPDVRKMLLTARAYAEGSRALVYFCSVQNDLSLFHPDAAKRKAADDVLALLTPIVKAFITDNGWIATSHCLQVFGGHGYIGEWGMEQYVRDARINLIYEGTNTVQSLDLLGRKVLADGGNRLRIFGAQVQAFCDEHARDEGMREFIEPLNRLTRQLTKLTMDIGMKTMGNADEVGAASVDYLRVCGHWVFAWLYARMAQVALARAGGGDPFYRAKLATARFYFAKLLPEVEGLTVSARAGLAPLVEMEDAMF
ncbi:MAG: acyl-CoA dehydrogenase [Aquabacterium sp.]|nr:MAG: acyl-CoA dehydrogenase [Aquabacterium sp.]